MASWRTRTSTGIRPQYSSRSACSAVTACPRTAQRQPGKSSICKPESKRKWLKKETHAARWGLLRGYSSKATKWVDFVMTDSTRRESCHSLKVTAKRIRVKRHLRIGPEPPNYWWNYRYPSLTGGFPPPQNVSLYPEPIDRESLPYLPQHSGRSGGPGTDWAICHSHLATCSITTSTSRCRVLPGMSIDPSTRGLPRVRNDVPSRELCRIIGSATPTPDVCSAMLNCSTFERSLPPLASSSRVASKFIPTSM